jgi:hypothetical protein
MGIADYLQMPVMASINALPNCTAIGTPAPAVARASILAMLADMTPFFDELFTGWRVSFLTSEPGTLRIRALMSAPSSAIPQIRSSAIRVALESTLSAAFPFGRN